MVLVYLIITLNLMQVMVMEVNFYWMKILGADSCNKSIMCI